MAIGIENFREVGTFSGRVTLGQTPEGKAALVATKGGLLGKIADWIQPEHTPQQRLDQNRQVRQAFYDSLVKSMGQDLADRVLRRTLGVDGVGFLASPRSLHASQIRQVMSGAGEMFRLNYQQNQRSVERFMANGLDQAVFLETGTEPDLRGAPDLKEAFRNLVEIDPDLKTGRFSDGDLRSLAQQAARDCVAARERRFDSQYPELAKLENGHRHDAGSWFEAMRGDIQGSALDGPGKVAARAALDDIESTRALRGETRFDPERALAQQDEIAGHRDRLEAHRGRIESMLALMVEDSPERTMLEALSDELTHQMDQLNAKLEIIDQYRQSDPLSAKAVAYDKLVWAQSSLLALEDAQAQLSTMYADLPDGSQRKQLVSEALEKLKTVVPEEHERVLAARESWQQASLDRPEDATTQIKQHKKDEIARLEATLEHLRIILPWQHLTEGRAESRLNEMRVKALDTAQDWHVIDRKFTVERDGATSTWRAVITPFSQIDGVVGERYRAEGRGGVSAGNRHEPEHARNGMHAVLYRVGEDGTETKVTEEFGFGVVDAWKIKDKDAREQAALNGAKEVLTAIMDVNEDFQARAIENQQQGRPPSKLVHVDLNLITADSTIRGKLSEDYNEAGFTRSEFDAFAAHDGVQQLPTKDGGTVPVEVESITFSFGVNALAMGTGGILKGSLVTEGQRWDAVEAHDKANLEKLLGDLQPGMAPGGHVGRIVDRLRERADAPDTGATEKRDIERLIGRIQRQVDETRELYVSGDYKRGIDDAYKMVRQIGMVCDLASDALKALDDQDMLIAKSAHCKSNKDRGGMSRVESWSAAIIGALGGNVEPKKGFENPEDQRIYDIVATSSGQVEVQTYNTGLGGSKNAKEAKSRFGDEGALGYAKGMSSFAEA
ncbi:MAG: inositol phosphate phosphatase SopB [Dongiaceae bacterium]